MVKYTKEFINEVRNEYPEWTALHTLLDNGNLAVGRYLDDSSHFGMSPEKIVAAFNEGRQETVKEAAEKAVRRRKLYEEWIEIYQLWEKQKKEQSTISSST
jgi:hypothetical protein